MTHTVEQIEAALAKLREQYDEATSVYTTESARLLGNMAKLEAWLWKNKEHTADGVIGEYVQLRDERSALKAQYEERDRELKQKMEAREGFLLQVLNDIGADSIKGGAGTAYITTQTRSSCSDWPLFWGYIKEHDRFDLLEKRVSQKPIKDMLENGEDLPPAINTFTERVVTIRRS